MLADNLMGRKDFNVRNRLEKQENAASEQQESKESESPSASSLEFGKSIIHDSERGISSFEKRAGTKLSTKESFLKPIQAASDKKIKKVEDMLR